MKNALQRYNVETRQYWFNADSMEANIQFEMVGILMGLAIYNSNILDVQFPPVVYKKMLGVDPTFDDLECVRDCACNRHTLASWRAFGLSFLPLQSRAILYVTIACDDCVD